MNFDFHPPTAVIPVHIRLPVMAVAAFAVVSALESRAVAFAVFFSAL